MILKTQLSFILLAVVFGLAGGGLSSYLLVTNQAQAQSQNILNTQQLVVTDRRGRIRSNINAVGNREELTEFKLYDNNGTPRMVFLVHPGRQNPEIMFFDAKGRATKGRHDQMPWKQAPVTQQQVTGTVGKDSVSMVERKQLRLGKSDAVTPADLDVLITQLELIMDKLDELAAYH